MNEEILAKLDRIEQLTLMGAKDVLNIEDVAAYTGFTKGYIYRVISRGDLPHYKGGGKCVFFRREDVNAWLLSKRVSSKDEMGAKAAAYVVNHPIRKGGAR